MPQRPGWPVGDPAGQALLARHIAWIGAAWSGSAPDAGHIRGLARLYLADERFAAHDGGAAGAAHVRDALFAATA
jgi:hypothetical protein